MITHKTKGGNGDEVEMSMLQARNAHVGWAWPIMVDPFFLTLVGHKRRNHQVNLWNQLAGCIVARLALAEQTASNDFFRTKVCIAIRASAVWLEMAEPQNLLDAKNWCCSS